MAKRNAEASMHKKGDTRWQETEKTEQLAESGKKDNSQRDQSGTGDVQPPAKRRRVTYESETRRDRRKDDWRDDEEPGTTLVPVSPKDSITGTRAGVEEPGTTAVPMSSKEQTPGTRAGDQEHVTASVPMRSKEPAEGTHAGAEEPDGNGVTYAYELRWALTGALIRACVSKRDVSVEQLGDQLDGVYFEEDGVPPAIDDAYVCSR